MTYIQLSKNLRYKRKEYGLTQEDVSDFLNISRQAYSNYETGNRTPDLETLMNLCRLYNLTLDELITQNLSNRIAEPTDSYHFSIAKNASSILYLIDEEVDLIMRYRDMDEEDRRLIRKIIKP